MSCLSQSFHALDLLQQANLASSLWVPPFVPWLLQACDQSARFIDSKYVAEHEGKWPWFAESILSAGVPPNLSPFGRTGAFPL